MKKLLKALAVVRTEAHYINLLTKADWDIYAKYSMSGFWGTHTQMIINGIDISEFAHAALLQMAETLPDLFRVIRVSLDPLPKNIEGRGYLMFWIGKRLAGLGIKTKKCGNVRKSNNASK